MGIMDLINKQKEKFRAKQDAAREQKLVKTRLEAVRAKKIISEKKEIEANEKIIKKSKEGGFLSKIASKVRENSARNSQQRPSFDGGIFAKTAQPGSNPFTQSSGHNPFTSPGLGSSNPFTLTASAPKARHKKKKPRAGTVIIYR